jgi:hypothetical protein
MDTMSPLLFPAVRGCNLVIGPIAPYLHLCAKRIECQK